MIYTDLTKKAMKLCFEAHKDQLDKSGTPYVIHPLHVAEQMPDETTTVVALLHDDKTLSFKPGFKITNKISPNFLVFNDSPLQFKRFCFELWFQHHKKISIERCDIIFCMKQNFT